MPLQGTLPSSSRAIRNNHSTTTSPLAGLLAGHQPPLCASKKDLHRMQPTLRQALDCVAWCKLRVSDNLLRCGHALQWDCAVWQNDRGHYITAWAVAPGHNLGPKTPDLEGRGATMCCHTV